MTDPGVEVKKRDVLRDMVIESIFKELKDLERLSATVGYQGESGSRKAPDSDLSVASLATVHTYKTYPFMQRAATSKEPGKHVAKAFKEGIEGKGYEHALQVVGEKLANAVRDEIVKSGRLIGDDRSIIDNVTVQVRTKGFADG